MSYINESVSSLSDFVTKLNAFLTGTPGWTQDELNTGTGRWAIHKGTVFISARWDTTTPGNLGLYHALGYTGGNDPGNHPNDSGNGAISGTNATLGGQRHVPVTNTPIQYWAFTDSGQNEVHVVVQTTTTNYVHLRFGTMQKVGTWTGGEYCCGYRVQTSASLPARQAGSTCMLDGLLQNGTNPVTGAELYAATIHAEGLQNQGGTGKWMVHMHPGQPSGSLGNDRASVARIHAFGGFRAGPIASQFGRFTASSTKGVIPMYPITAFHIDRTTGDVRALGTLRDVRGVNLEFHTAGVERVIGSDTWVLFPTFARWPGSGGHTGFTGYQGIALKKVT